MIHIVNRIQQRVLVNPITGGRRTLTWFQKIRVVHKAFRSERPHTNENCWCYPLITEAKLEDE